MNRRPLAIVVWTHGFVTCLLLTMAVACGVRGPDRPPSRPAPVRSPPVVPVVPPAPPPAPFTVEGDQVGIVMANAGTADPRTEFEAMYELGARHVRLSAYYRLPFALHRTIREAWVADSVGLALLVDVQTYPNEWGDPPKLEDWTAAWDSIATSLPPGAVVSVGNEPNAEHWWPWSEELLDAFWRSARAIAHQHGRTFAGPHLAGDWPEALEWLSAFLERNPPPDILTVHYYGWDVGDWMALLPWSGPVWLAEASLAEATPEEQAEHLPTLFSGTWERTYLYSWVDPKHPVQGGPVGEKLREILR